MSIRSFVKVTVLFVAGNARDREFHLNMSSRIEETVTEWLYVNQWWFERNPKAPMKEERKKERHGVKE
jgi:hypothetical protein